MRTSALDKHALKMTGVKLEFGNPEHIKAKKTFEELAHLEEIEEELQIVCDECDSNMHIDVLDEAGGWILWRCNTECSHCYHFCDEMMYTDLKGNIISGRPKVVVVDVAVDAALLPLEWNLTVTNTASGNEVPTCWREK